jgi:hypothetical protein
MQALQNILVAVTNLACVQSVLCCNTFGGNSWHCLLAPHAAAQPRSQGLS